MTIRILHLSDLHFGDDHYFGQSGNDHTSLELGDAVADALSRASIGTLDAVVITGDLFSRNQPEDLFLARDGLRKLIQNLNIDASRLHFVPGNRDLSWDPKFKTARFRFYDELLESISSSCTRRNQLPTVVQSLGNGEPDVELILLDSCHLESPEMGGYGRVGETQIRALRGRISQTKSPPAVRIAALHHHLLPVWGVTRIWNPESPQGKPMDSVSLTVDALSVLEELAACEVSVVLHGHQHKPQIARYESYLGTPYSIVVVGAGTAGAKPEGNESTRRQFFVHEIDPYTLRCLSFIESEKNSSMFRIDQESSKVLALVPPIQDGHQCVVDLRASRLRETARSTVEDEIKDVSDLFYLFLSVENCAAARSAIRELEKAWQTGGRGTAGPVPDLVITEMYDLMGRWDLLVRFRTSHSDDARAFAKKVDQRLKGVSEGDLTDYDREHFPPGELMDVMEEHASLAAKLPTRIPGRRTRLGNTEQYESRRCQRAFIFIPCGLTHKRERIVRDLRRRTSLKEFEENDRIIESYSLSQHDIMIEIFLTCSKSVLLNKLNREIEECLAPYGVQKYTLLCYGYEELPIAAREVQREPVPV